MHRAYNVITYYNVYIICSIWLHKLYKSITLYLFNSYINLTLETLRKRSNPLEVLDIVLHLVMFNTMSNIQQELSKNAVDAQLL